MITHQHIIDWLQSLAEVMAENKDYLTELDAAIGDADHGINMNRGFQKVQEKLPSITTPDIGEICKIVSMTLISTIGGASGPLYGTFFLKASAKTNKKEQLTKQELGEFLQAGVEGIIQRGKAKLQDKTMLDTLIPAIEAYHKETELLVALKQAVSAAEAGMKSTIPLIARKGRASYLGERSIGHQDPGATSSYLMLKTLLATIEHSN
ncbi:MAG TPA: dihydroxyacetone kinase subunit L [Cyanothece sp. UBA12306]|nr:dihydroxyacetone kinase subunit L [Cyanothece sp. UBA12306]